MMQGNYYKRNIKPSKLSPGRHNKGANKKMTPNVPYSKHFSKKNTLNSIKKLFELKKFTFVNRVILLYSNILKLNIVEFRRLRIEYSQTPYRCTEIF